MLPIGLGPGPFLDRGPLKERTSAIRLGVVDTQTEDATARILPNRNAVPDAAVNAVIVFRAVAGRPIELVVEQADRWLSATRVEWGEHTPASIRTVDVELHHLLPPRPVVSRAIPDSKRRPNPLVSQDFGEALVVAECVVISTNGEDDAQSP